MEKTIENFPGSPKYDAKHWAFDFDTLENQMPNLKLNSLMEFCVKAATDLTKLDFL